MIRFDRSQQALAVSISALAGFVDAIGFVESSGFFVSFMTGNTTRLAVGAAGWQYAALIAGAIIMLFVAGVVFGSIVGARFAAARTRGILLLVTMLLAAAMALRLVGFADVAIACLAFAMGTVNAALQGHDGTVVGVTYMTGTLVQMGQKFANAVRGEGDGRWFHHFGLWMGLVAGAVVGARALLWSVPFAFGLAVAFAMGLTLWATVQTRKREI